MNDIIDVSKYILDITNALDKKNDFSYDKQAVTQDLKEYIYEQASKIADQEQITMNVAVIATIEKEGTPEEFANRFVQDIRNEKRYLILKIIIAFFIALFPFLLIFIYILIK